MGVSCSTEWSPSSPPPELALLVAQKLTRDWPSRVTCASLNRSWRAVLTSDEGFRAACGWLAEENPLVVGDAPWPECGSWRATLLHLLPLARAALDGDDSAPPGLRVRVFVRFRPLSTTGTVESKPTPVPLHLRLQALQAAHGGSTADAGKRLFGAVNKSTMSVLEPPARSPRGARSPRSQNDAENASGREEADAAEAHAVATASVLSVGPTSVLCLQPGGLKRFEFDGALKSETPNDEVFASAAAPLVRSWLNGATCVLFACGATGSGKTSTLHGVDPLADGVRLSPPLSHGAGVAPRAASLAVAEVARRAAAGFQPAQRLFVSYCQVAGDHVTDLLAEPSGDASAAAIGAWAGTAAAAVAAGAGEVAADTPEALEALLLRGAAAKHVAATAANASSSRAHALLTLRLRPSCASLVVADLGGSERASARNGTRSGTTSQNNAADTDDDALRRGEAIAINLSLLALASCFDALANGASHVPFQDSKLTAVLAPSLRAAASSSRGRVVLLATCRSEAAHGREALRSLRFAERVRGTVVCGAAGGASPAPLPPGAGGAAEALAALDAEVEATEAHIARNEVWRGGKPAGAEAARERLDSLLATRRALFGAA